MRFNDIIAVNPGYFSTAKKKKSKPVKREDRILRVIIKFIVKFEENFYKKEILIVSNFSSII